MAEYTGRQAAQYIPGGAYGEGQELMSLQKAPGVSLSASEMSAAQMGAVANTMPLIKQTLNHTDLFTYYVLFFYFIFTKFSFIIHIIFPTVAPHNISPFLFMSIKFF